MKSMSPRKLSKICVSGPILWLVASHSVAFQISTHLRRHDNSLLIKLASTKNNDRSKNDDDTPYFSSDDEFVRGQELADQFYDYQLKSERAAEAASSSSPNISDKTPEIYETNATPPPLRLARKFTGTASPPSSLFANNNQQSDSAPSTNIQREREREFDLAGRFERTFGIQVAILVASIIFALSVGLSGGITDGSDRDFNGDDYLIEDAVIEQMERLRTDDAAEVLFRQQQQATPMQRNIQESQWL